MAGAAIAVGSALCWYFAVWIDREDATLRAADAEQRRSARYFELTRDLVCTAGFDGVFTQLNAAWTETLGWSEEELCSRPFVEFVHPDDRETTEREAAALADGEVTVDFSNRYTTKDGGWRWLEWRAIGNPEEGLIYASARDVTDRKKIEAALEASERQARQVLETANDAFVAMDARGLITDWNPQAEITFGWSRKEALGRILGETIIPEAHRDAHWRGVERFLSSEKGKVMGQVLNLPALHRDGHEFPVEFTISPLRTKDGWSFNAFLRDITERHEIERTKEEFTSVVSHELRTPLTSIRGSLGLLESGVLGELPEKGQRMIEIAVQNTDRLVRLINDILDIERIDSDGVDMQKEPCDAAELIARGIESLESLAAEAEVTVTTDAAATPLHADPDRIIQTLTNLISNAVKFSAAGSTVTVSCARRGAEVVFRVTDEGRGIPAENIDSIFGRFQQVDASDSRERGGTGLGLAICRKIVEKHGGRIWVESVPGEGSTFSFALPALAEQHNAQRPPPASGGPKVLICDDDDAVVRVVGAMLEQRGYRVIEASSGEQAVERAIAERPDVILLDLLMPGMSGWETAAALGTHSETRKIPIVILSVLSEGEGEKPSRPVLAWLDKPLDESALYAALERAVNLRNGAFTVLIVEDDQDLAEILTAMFQSHGFETYQASTGTRAIELSQRVLPDLLVLDIGLPEKDGFEVVEWLRSHEHLKAVPTVVYTARNLDEADRERLRLGDPTEFLTKSQISPQDFEQRIMGLLARLTSELSPEREDEPKAHPVG